MNKIGVDTNVFIYTLDKSSFYHRQCDNLYPKIYRGGEDLPYDDDTPLETERHLYQIILLLETLVPWLRKLGKGYAGGNMFLYFSPNQIKTEMFRGPDFFVVTDADFKERKSWVVWEEGLSPNVVIELLSDTTRNEDKTNKKRTNEEKERADTFAKKLRSLGIDPDSL